MKKRPEKITIEELRRLTSEREEEQRRLEAESDAAIADYQRSVAELHARGGSKVVATPGDDGVLWYFEPHDAGDEPEAPAGEQTPFRYEPDWEANGDPDPSLSDDRVKVRARITERNLEVSHDKLWSTFKAERRATPLVVKPPGARIMQLIDYLPAKGILRKDLAQVVADMRDEHFECLTAGDKRGARIALWRGRFDVARAILPSWAMGLVSWFTRWVAAKYFQGS